MPVYKQISKLTNKVTWYASFYYKDWQGNRKRKKLSGFLTKKSAEKAERDFLTKQSLVPDVPFIVVVEAYLDSLQKRCKASTYSEQKTLIEFRIQPTFATIPINKITPVMIRKWQEKKLAGLSLSTAKVTKSILSSIFNFAVKYYGLTQNPATLSGGVSSASKEKKKDIRFLTLDQFKQLQAVMNKRKYHVFFTLLFYSGMRKGEALAITPADIDTEKNIITVNKRIYHKTIDTPKSKAGYRKITMPPDIIAMLQDFIQALQPIEPHQRIFECIGYSSVNPQLAKYLKQAGLPKITVHDLRHSHASLLVEKGIDWLTIKDRLGHENIKMTIDTYSHLYPEKEKSVALLLQNLIDEKEIVPN